MHIFWENLKVVSLYVDYFNTLTHALCVCVFSIVYIVCLLS